MLRRWPMISFRQLLSYSLMLLSPTVLALDALVFWHALDVDRAIWVVAGSMISAIAIAWLFLTDLGEIVQFIRQTLRGDPQVLPDLKSSLARDLAQEVSRLDTKWRRQVDAFSQSINADMEILESLSDALILVDPEFCIVRANLAAQHIFGGLVAGRQMDDGLAHPALCAATRQALITMEPQALEIQIGDVPRYFQASVQPLAPLQEPRFDNAFVSPVAAAVVTLHEITELKRAAEARDRFVANVSHELGTPLSTIVGFIETIQGHARDDAHTRDRFLSIMHDQAQRMSRILSDLLTLARLQEGDAAAPASCVAIRPLLDNVAAALELRAAARGITIAVDTPPTACVTGNQDQLFQVFQNLIENAIKYGRENGIVAVMVRVNGAMVSVIVRDDGVGIQARHLPHLGERFYRVDPARARGTGGSGLGLAIVSSIVKRHGGCVTFDSRPAEGTSVKVDLHIWRDGNS